MVKPPFRSNRKTKHIQCKGKNKASISRANSEEEEDI